MASVAELLLLVKGDTSGANAALDATGSKLGGLGKALVGAGIGAAAGKVAQEVAGIGIAFDDVYDGLVVKTGATGAELEGLQQSFRNVVSTVPVDFATAGEAVGAVQVRLGQTGGDVDALTVQFANLSRITGTDVTTNVDAAADAMNAFGVPASEQSATIDALFAASQKAGVSFDQMAGEVAKAAPQMHLMGMSVDQSAGFLSTLSAAGLDAGPILKGMTKFAADGGKAFTDLASAQTAHETATKEAAAAEEALASAIETYGAGSTEAAAAQAQLAAAQGYVEETANDVALATDAAAASQGPMMAGVQGSLQAIKDLGPGADQTKMAIELFGKKAGPELVLALNNGLISVDDLTAGLEGMGPGINETAAATDDMQQKFDLLKNKVMLAAEGLAPLGMTLQPIVGMLPVLGGALGGVVPLLGGLATTITTTVIPAVVSLAAPFLPIILAVGAVVAIFAALKYAYDHNLGGIQEKVASFRETVSQAFAQVKDWIVRHKDMIVTALLAILGPIGWIAIAFREKGDEIRQKVGEVKDWIVSHKDMIVNALLLLTGPLGALAVLWREKGDEIKAAVGEVVERVQEFVEDVRTYFEQARATIQEKVDAAKAFLVEAWDSIVQTIRDALGDVQEAVRLAWDAVLREIREKLTAILGRVSEGWRLIHEKIDEVLAKITGLVDGVLSWLESTFGLRMEAARQIVDAAFSAMQQVVDTVIGTIRGLISGLLQFLQGDFQGGVSTVIESVKGFFSGMAAAVGTALSGLKTSVETGIRNVVAVFQPIIDKIEELTGIDLYETGRALLEGLQKGIRDAVGVVQGALDWLASHLPQWVRTALGMSSPSRVFMAIGRDVVRGLAIGIEEAGPVVFGAVTDLARRTADAARSSLSIMDYIRTAGWGSGGLGGNALAAWMRSQGFDEETIASYKNLHSMREGGHWKTREAFALWRRRVMPRGGDWTGAGQEPETESWQATEREWPGFTQAMRSFQIPPVGFGAGPAPIGGRGGTGPIVGIPGPGKGGGSAPTGGPVDVKLAGGKLEGDMRVKEPIVVRVTIGSREIDAIATEVVRKISGSLLAKPLVGTP